jgi:drug/metabolite transporter (DMT)-like permease
MFTALRFLPLADAIAIAFVMPFIMLLLGRLVLGEEVGPRRLAACAVGFVGTLMVIQPSFAAVGPLALLPVAVAVIFAFYMLVSRQVAKDCDPLVLQAVSGLIATAVLLPAMVVLAPFGLPGTGFVIPGGGDAALLLLLGTIGTVAHLLMTWSLRFAPSATVAPMQYLEIPFATLIGWVIFGDLPNGLAAVGIAVTMGAGLYVVLREHAVGRQRTAG